MAIYSEFSHKKIVICHSYVSLPEGYHRFSPNGRHHLEFHDRHRWLAVTFLNRSIFNEKSRGAESLYCANTIYIIYYIYILYITGCRLSRCLKSKFMNHVIFDVYDVTLQ